MKGSTLQTLDLSEEGLSQEPKIGEGAKGSRHKSLDLSEQGVSQEPKKKKEWICPKRAWARSPR